MPSLALILVAQTVELIYGGGKDTEYFQKANSLVAQGKYEDAVEEYQKAVDIYPGFKEAYNNMGVALTLLGDTEAAMEAFYKAKGLDSSYIDPLLNLASCFAGLGRADSATFYYNLVLRLDPDNPKAKAAFASAQRAAVADTSAGEAEADLLAQKQRELAENPSDPQIYYDIAVLLDKAGRYEEAIDYYMGFLNTSRGQEAYDAMREFAQKRFDELARALRRK